MPALGVGHFGWYWFSGVVISAALVPLVRFGPRSMWAQFGAIALVLVMIGLACTFSEAIVFFPEMKAQMMIAVPGGTVVYLAVAALLVGLAKLLEADRPRGRAGSASLLCCCGSVDPGFRCVVRALLPDFRSHRVSVLHQEVLSPCHGTGGGMGIWFWAYQLGRGLLMTLAVVPVIYALRLPRWKAAVVVGLMVWIVGGGATLLVPSTVMVPAQRYMHILEIMTQNVSLGMTAVWLLRPRTKKVAAPMEQTTMA